MQFDIHQIITSTLQILIYRLFWLFDPVGEIVGNVRRSPTRSKINTKKSHMIGILFPLKIKYGRRSTQKHY